MSEKKSDRKEVPVGKLENGAELYRIDRPGQDPLFRMDKDGVSLILGKTCRFRKKEGEYVVIDTIKTDSVLTTKNDYSWLPTLKYNLDDYKVKDIISEIERYNLGKRIDLYRGPLRTLGLIIARTVRHLSRENENEFAMSFLKGIGYLDEEFLGQIMLSFSVFKDKYKSNESNLDVADDIVSSLEKVVLKEEPEVVLDDPMSFFKIMNKYDKVPFNLKYVLELKDLVKSIEIHEWCRSESRRTHDHELRSVLDVHGCALVNLSHILDCTNWPTDRYVVAGSLGEYKKTHLKLKKALESVDFADVSKLKDSLDFYENCQKEEDTDVERLLNKLNTALGECDKHRIKLVEDLDKADVPLDHNKRKEISRKYYKNTGKLRGLMECVAQPITDYLHNNLRQGSNSGRLIAVKSKDIGKDIFFKDLIRAFYLKTLRKDRLSKTDLVRDVVYQFINEDVDISLEKAHEFFSSFYDFLSTPINFKYTL